MRESQKPEEPPGYLRSVGARHSEPRQRLAAELLQTRLEIAQRKDESSGWWKRANDLIRQAEQAAAYKHEEAAWSLVLDSRRCLIRLLSPEEKDALAISLRKEATKFPGWRGAAMTQLLGKAPEVPDYPRLMEAQSQVDSNYANRFRRLRAGRNELASLLLVLLLALAALVSVFLLGNKVDLTRVTFTNSKLLVVVLLFGVIGATLSAMQRSSRRAPMLVPDARAAAIASVIRSVSGAGGGLVALAAAQAGLLGSEPGTVFLGAFAAGFSERFILRFLPGGEEGEDHEPTNPGGEDLTSSDDS